MQRFEAAGGNRGHGDSVAERVDDLDGITEVTAGTGMAVDDLDDISPPKTVLRQVASQGNVRIESYFHGLSLLPLFWNKRNKLRGPCQMLSHPNRAHPQDGSVGSVKIPDNLVHLPIFVVVRRIGLDGQDLGAKVVEQDCVVLETITRKREKLRFVPRY